MLRLNSGLNSKSDKSLTKGLIIFSLCLAILSLTACSSKEPVAKGIEIKPPAPYVSQGKVVNGPVDLTYVVENPIKVEEVIVKDYKTNKDKISNEYQAYFQISGLKEEAIETKINNEIKALFDDLLPYGTGEKLPPYRGIKVALGEKWKINNNSITVYASFNANNILSVVGQVHAAYEVSNQVFEYFSLTETLNFDLNTGKTFLLEDVFTNDVDGLALVNEEVLKETNSRRLTGYDFVEGHHGLNLIAPFKGVGKEQKFYLASQGLTIVLDHNNTEFDLGLMGNSILIPYFGSYQKHFAFTKRFYDEDGSIYKGKVSNKKFIVDHYSNHKYDHDNFEKNGTRWIFNVHLTEGLHQNIVEKVESTKRNIEQEATSLANGKKMIVVDSHINTTQIGNYVNINKSYYIDTGDGGRWGGKAYLYTKEGEPVKIEDLFVEGYEYKGIIEKYLAREVNNVTVGARDVEPLLDTLMVTLHEDSFNFMSETKEWRLGNVYPINVQIPYSVFGLENLKIFDNP